MSYTPINLLELLTKYGIKQTPGWSDLPTGWIGVVDDLMKDLIDLGWDKDLHQIKEKFGGLRFYIGETTEAINTRIHDAELSCEEVCHDCGSTVDLSSVSYYILCRQCRLNPVQEES